MSYACAVALSFQIDRANHIKDGLTYDIAEFGGGAHRGVKRFLPHVRHKPQAGVLCGEAAVTCSHARRRPCFRCEGERKTISRWWRGWRKEHGDDPLNHTKANKKMTRKINFVRVVSCVFVDRTLFLLNVTSGMTIRMFRAKAQRRKESAGGTTDGRG